jgi:hypothetical protein
MAKKVPIAVVAVVAAVLAINLVGISDSEGSWRWGNRYHRGKTRINWKVSGTIVNVQLAIPTMTGIDNVPAFLIQALLKGVPGNAQFTVVGIPNAFDPNHPECGGPGQYFNPNDMVITFPDLSMIFAMLDRPDGGWVCIQEDGTVTAIAYMTITGGIGKYKGASGDFIGEFIGQQVGTSGALQAETGTIEGWIER